MAALFATLAVEGPGYKFADGSATTFGYYFLGAVGVYTDATVSAATGVKDVTATLQGKVVLSEVGDLIEHGILRRIEVGVGNNVNGVDTVNGVREIKYAGTKSATIELATGANGGLIGCTYNGGTKLKGQKILEIHEGKKMIKM